MCFSCCFLLLAACSFSSSENPNGEESIRKNAKSYVDTFNQKNSKKLAEFWAEDAEFINPITGVELKGRKEIEEEFSDMFMQMDNLKLEIAIDSIEFKNEHTAIEKGIAIVTQPGEKPKESSYIVTYEKQGDSWLIKSVTEVDLETPPTHYEQLKQLDWMIGDWIDKGENISIESTCKWDKYKNFITQSFKVSIQGRDQFEGRQIIGWDAAKNKIRSWTFDSDGGFAEGEWTRKGDQWMVTASSTLPDGRKGSATNIYRSVDHNSYVFQSTGREIDGEILPNIDEVTVIRKK